MKIYKTALVCLITCAVAFFGCSCSLTDDSESSEPKRSSITEKSVTTPSAQDVENDKDYADVKTDYAYETLTDDYVKELYMRIAKSVDTVYAPNITTTGSLSDYQITQAVEAYKNDHPETFWLKGSSLFVPYGDTTSVKLDYTVQNDELIAAKKKFDTAVTSALKKLPSGNDFEREEYINNYIIDNCRYDEEAAENNDVQGNENDAYGALVDGKAVCEGYARAFQLLCNKANIDCVLLSGTADSDNHAWNGVKIGGDWYQIDVTWNDTDGENNYAENDYFNLTDDLMFKDHKLSYKYSELNSQTYLSVATWCNFYVPKCTAEKYNYFNYKYPTVSDPDNADDVSQAVANAAKNGDEYFSIVVDKNTDFDYMYDRMMNDGYLYNWISEANEINGYSPRLAERCYVYCKDELGVLTVELEYVD